MKTLISTVKATAIAFGDGGPLPAAALTAADIAAAEERYVVPVVGRALYERLLAGDHADFTADFLAAPVALLARLVAQGRLDIRTGPCGTTAPRPDDARPADDAARRRAMRSLRIEARALLERARARLAASPAEFPEYDPARDILNRCTTYGGIVQIH